MWLKHLKEGLRIGWPVVGENTRRQRTLRIYVGSIRAPNEPPEGTFVLIGSEGTFVPIGSEGTLVPKASLTNFAPGLVTGLGPEGAANAVAAAATDAAAAAANTGTVINEVFGDIVSFAPPAWSQKVHR